jgi:hypothetical protein
MSTDLTPYSDPPAVPGHWAPTPDPATWGAEPDCVYWVGSFPAWADQEPLADADDEEASNAR